MYYQIKITKEHFEHVIYESGEPQREVLDSYELKIGDLTKERLDKILAVLEPLYEEHIVESLNEEIRDYEKWKANRKHKEQCQAGL